MVVVDLKWIDGAQVAVSRELSCTRLQARIAMGSDMCAHLDAIGADPATPWELRERLRSSGSWDRSHPFINQIGVVLGLSSDQIDALFVKAQGL
jgi:hypothetical protein